MSFDDTFNGLMQQAAPDVAGGGTVDSDMIARRMMLKSISPQSPLQRSAPRDPVRPPRMVPLTPQAAAQHGDPENSVSSAPPPPAQAQTWGNPDDPVVGPAAPAAQAKQWWNDKDPVVGPAVQPSTPPAPPADYPAAARTAADAAAGLPPAPTPGAPPQSPTAPMSPAAASPPPPTATPSGPAPAPGVAMPPVQGFGQDAAPLAPPAPGAPQVPPPAGVAGTEKYHGQWPLVAAPGADHPIKPIADAIDYAKNTELYKGFRGSIIGQNAKMTGDAFEGFGILLDKPWLKNKGTEISKWGEKDLEGFKARVPSFVDIKTDKFENFIGDLGSYAGYGTGQMLGSSAPSLALGGGMAVLTANPLVGLAIGAAGPSYIQNYGDVYGSARDDKDIAKLVKDGKLSEYDLAYKTAWYAVPVAALDVIGLENVVSKTVLADMKKNLIKRIVKGIAVGSLTEGSTEGMQEVISQFAQDQLGSQSPFKDKMVSVIDNFLGGFFGGGAMGGMGAASNKHRAAEQPQPGAQSAPAQQPATDAEVTKDLFGEGVKSPEETKPASDHEVSKDLFGEGAQPPAPQPTAPQPTTPGTGEHETAESHVLRQAGLSDEQIAGMSDEERLAKAGEAIERGEAQPPAEAAGEAEKYTIKSPLGAESDDETWPVQVFRNKDGGIDSLGVTHPDGHFDMRDVAPGHRSLSPEQAIAETLGDHPQGGQADVSNVAKVEEGPAPGKRDNPVEVKSADDVIKAGEVAVQPTPAQAAAENYQHAHIEIPHLGLSGRNNISIETPVGGTRHGPIDPETGKPTWTVENMPVAYGRIKGTKGMDGQALDVFVGPNPDAGHVFILDQVDPDKKGPDEHKIFAGFQTEAQALKAYEDSYNDHAFKRFGAIHKLSADEFKEWIKNGDHTKPFSPVGETPTGAEQKAAEEGTTPEQGLQGLTDLFGGVKAAVDDVGIKSDEVHQPDIEKAAEIAKTEGHDADDSFNLAFVRNLVKDGLLSEAQVKELFNADTAKAVLEPEVHAADQPTAEAGGAEPGAGVPDRGTSGAGEVGTGSGTDRGEEGRKIQGAEAGETTGSGAGETGRHGPAFGGETTGGPRTPAGGPAEQPATSGERAAEPDKTTGVGAEQQPSGGEAATTAGPSGHAEPAKAQVSAVTHTFTTAKGSTYEHFGDQTTARDKAARPEHPEPKERGPQPRSERTYYVTEQQANALAPPQGAHELVDHGDGTISLATPTKTGAKGIAPSASHITYEKEPRAGLVPIEVWKQARKSKDASGYTRIHFGNPITQVNKAGAAKETVSEKPNRLVIGSGVVLRSVSGRTMSPAPKIDATSDRKTAATLQRLHAWLIDEAKEEARSTKNDSVLQQLERLDPAHLSQADQDMVNLTLFGDHEGATEKNVVKEEEKPAAEEPKVSPSTRKLFDEFFGKVEGAEKVLDPVAKFIKREADFKATRAAVLAAFENKEQQGAAARALNALNGKLKAAETAAKVEEREATEQEAADEGKSKEKMGDVGEKIGGARKDQWAQKGLGISDLDSMTGAERAENVTKQNVFPRPDYVDLVENNEVTPKAAYLIKRIYDRLATKPGIADDQKAYIAGLGILRDVMAKAKSEEDVKNIHAAFREAVGTDAKPGETPYWKYMRVIEQRRRSNTLYVNYEDERAAARAVDKENFPYTEPWQRVYRVGKRTHYESGTNKDLGTYYVWYRKSDGVQIDKARYDTQEAAIEAAKAAYEANGRTTGEGAEPNRPHLDNLDRAGPDYRKGADVTGQSFIDDFGFRGVEFGNWVASDERQKSVNLAYDALQDLARAIGIPPKALSLNGTLGLGFGSRGKGGKGAGAAHYEPGRLVINLTKIQGAGTLAHEWGHGLDHYLGELDRSNAYQGAALWASGGDNRPRHNDFSYVRRNLKPIIASAVTDVMQAMHWRTESPAEREERMAEIQKRYDSGAGGWKKARDESQKALRNNTGDRRAAQARLRKAEEQIVVWNDWIEREKARTKPKAVETSYFANAKKLSGKSGEDGYWARPTEMLARSFEAYVQDKLAEQGNKSQYLVHSTEPDRFGAAFRGNPYPVGAERQAINDAYDMLFQGMETVDGKLGPNTKITGSQKEPWITPAVRRMWNSEGLEEIWHKPEVTEITGEDRFKGLEEEMKALADDMAAMAAGDQMAAMKNTEVLADHFARHFNEGNSFPTIIAARKFAIDNGFAIDNKQVEEALEFGIVKAARQIVESEPVIQHEPEPIAALAKRASERDHRVFDKLVKLYQRQPRLGTRTSESVRDQAYSTPVPLAYLASRLADVTAETTVYEPSAGNGALLIEADPALVHANEINPERRANLEAQGFRTSSNDASEASIITPVDRVLANPPFGSVRISENVTKTFDLRDIRDIYETNQIDHAIALRALQAMKDDGKAVLILGSINKQAVSDEARAEAYHGAAKRQFFKTLLDRYNVVDHFTVSGDLYERQGSAWPVDVIVIDGRGKSSRPLPAANLPRIYTSWEDLGGVLNDHDSGRHAEEAGQPAGSAAAGEPGPAGGHEQGVPTPLGGGPAADSTGHGQPGGVRPGSDRGQPGAAQDRGASGSLGNGPGVGAERGGPGAETAPVGQSPGLNLDDLSKAFDDEIAAMEGKTSPSEPGPILKPEAVTPPAADTKTKIAELKAGLDKPGLTIAQRGQIKHQIDELERSPAPARESIPTPELIKQTVATGIQSVDDALSGLTQLFGGGKTIGEGLNFDRDTYEKAKVHFKDAAQGFKEFRSNLSELMLRMMRKLRESYGWTPEMLAKIKPYVIQFIADVNQGLVHLWPEEAPARPETIKREQETATQVAYEKRSKIEGLGTLVPVNMKAAITNALEKIEAKVGDIDEYVRKELGYKDKAELGEALAGEQVDAVAMAIDNIKRGSGFIIGDQTGIGKGRVNAALIRWAIKNGHVPVFVTAKPNLYGDMYRDLTDIGIKDMLGREPRMIMTNADESVPLNNEALDWEREAEEAKLERRKAPPRRGAFLTSALNSQHNTDLAQATNAEGRLTKHDIVFTTYNQMQTVEGEETFRRNFLRSIAPGTIFMFDESHEAGGQKTTRGKKGAPENRSQFTRSLINAAKGVMYSSATYAKRPDVMDLYSATDMKMAVAQISDLADAISRGGVPMQQVVASMLADAGQYARRERSYAGIDYHTPIVEVDRDTYDQTAFALRAIHEFSVAIQPVIKEIRKSLMGKGGNIGPDNAVGEVAVHSVKFTSIMHNVINQMLLALKAKPAAEAAIAAIRAGQKPVIALSSTMESFIDDVRSHLDLKIGDPFEGDFAKVLQKYLKRVRTLKIKDADGNVETYYISDAELGSINLRGFEHAQQQIDGLDLSGLPLSPIDAIKGEIEKAGYKVGEITGRSLRIEYGAGTPTLAQRPGKERSIAGRSQTIKAFNTRPENGGSHAMVINQAGSTGLSAHASSKYDDQSPRHMIIVQAEGNVDTHQQMLGRINRTGQVVLPVYTQMIAGVPAEIRPASVLLKKMGSLNANTTASKKGALMAKDVPDLMNKYGDEIAAQWAVDNPKEHFYLGSPVSISEAGKPDPKEAMHKLSGKIALFPMAEQEAWYDQIIAEYNSTIEQADASGTNMLEAKTLDFKAVPLQHTEVVPAKNDSGSPFAAPVIVEKSQVRRLGKPFTPQEVIDRVTKTIGVTLADAPKVTRIEAVTPPGQGRPEVTAHVTTDQIPKASVGLGQTFYSQEDAQRFAAKVNKWLAENPGASLPDVQERISAFRHGSTPAAALNPLGRLGRILNGLNYDPTSEIGRKATQVHSEQKKQALGRFQDYRRKTLDDIGDAERRTKEEARLQDVKTRWEGVHDLVKPGASVTLKFASGNMAAVVLHVEQHGKPANPLALSTWGATFAVADANRQYRAPFSRLYADGKASTEDSLAVEVSANPYWLETPVETLQRFVFGADAKEERLIATGNLLAAFDWTGNTGQIANFSSHDGDIRQGVVLPRGFDLAKYVRAKGTLLTTADAMLDWMKAHPRQAMVSIDGKVSLTNQWGSYSLYVPKSKASGGQFFLDDDLIKHAGSFSSSGNKMVASFDALKVKDVATRLLALGAEFRGSAGELKTVDIPPPPSKAGGSEPPASPGIPRVETQAAPAAASSLSPQAAAREGEIADVLTRVMRHFVGPDAKLDFKSVVRAGENADSRMWGGDRISDQLGGQYSPLEGLIELSLAHPRLNPGLSAAHEAWHWIEDHFARDNEMAVMRADMPAITRLAARAFQRAPENMTNVPDYEMRAIAFEQYVTDRLTGTGNDAGLHMGVRMFFEKMRRMLGRMKNALNGLGFQTYEDIFERGLQGEMKNRPDRMADSGYSRVLGESNAYEAARFGQADITSGPLGPEPPPIGHPFEPGNNRPSISGRAMPTVRPDNFASKFRERWVKYFQPEMFSDKALEADPYFAEYKAAGQQERDSIMKRAEAAWAFWAKVPVTERLEYFKDVETGSPSTNPEFQQFQQRHRAMLNRAYFDEKQAGSRAQYRENYLPHIFDQADKVKAFFADLELKRGEAWFQKQRTFELIEEAMEHGFTLRTTNPEELVTERLMAGADMRMRMNLLRKMRDMRLALPVKGNPANLTWQKIKAPNGSDWMIAPDIQMLWENAVEARGLWQHEGLRGGAFRAWMRFKSAVVPIKLGLSGFHALHVQHIYYSNAISRGIKQMRAGHISEGLESMAEGFVGPITAAPGAFGGAAAGALLGSTAIPVGPYWGAIGGAYAGAAVMKIAKRMGMPDVPHLGKEMRKAWKERPGSAALTDEDRYWVDMMKEAGFVPERSEELKVRGKRRFAEAWADVQNGEMARILVGPKHARLSGSLWGAAMRRAMEAIQAPLFDEWIPNLKAVSFRNEVSALFERQPGLFDDDIQRRAALRVIGRQIDSRFGEMYYGNLFWNRTLKDTMIGVFLSLGWQYGFIQQFGGAALDLATPNAALDRTRFARSETAKTRRDASNRLTYLATYAMSGLLLTGLISYTLSGNAPTRLIDYVFPQVGGETADGAPRRSTQMTYTREIPMAIKHIQEEGGGVIGTARGLGNMAMNKTMLEAPLSILKNRNYFGAEVFDTNAPFYMQTLQALGFLADEQLNPISISGAKRALDTGGTMKKDVPLSILGFGPAPAYAERSAIDNRIYHLYGEHVAPHDKAYSDAERSKVVREFRAKLIKARKDGEPEHIADAYKEAMKAGVPKGTLDRVTGSRNTVAIYFFSKLPAADQMAILEMARDQAEFDKYARARIKSGNRNDDALKRDNRVPASKLRQSLPPAPSAPPPAQ